MGKRQKRKQQRPLKQTKSRRRKKKQQNLWYQQPKMTPKPSGLFHPGRSSREEWLPPWPTASRKRTRKKGKQRLLMQTIATASGTKPPTRSRKTLRATSARMKKRNEGKDETEEKNDEDGKSEEEEKKDE